MPLSIDFSELYRATSPHLLATAVEHRLVVRDAETLQIAALFSCSANVDVVAWAADSQLVAVASKAKKCAQIWSIVDPDWKCCIDEGVSGLSNILWSPDARHLLVFSDFQLRITVWSLVSKEAVYIQYPKYSNKGYAFGMTAATLLSQSVKTARILFQYMMPMTGRFSRYNLTETGFNSSMDVNGSKGHGTLSVETTDLEDIAWSPDGRFIAMWDTILEYKVLIYSPDGRLISSYSAYENGLGIKGVSWSPSAQFLAVGSFDEKLRLINNMTGNH
ncbi:YVTN repeat-like/Quino protein amine dehydrogenase [Rhizoclosmatium globosum]|uniref:YVTN repeat-like/Quino protein amine dehydrogenase n=1 Tax=Rhizoclosmatium globosum TaxID=329046 RepID=A0A1Y2CE81_9FUNG|nr:YVTN repeat-like/Quino protein amine dehydrogenase [Rhizoclosmatium globosum]|eukprot:ORY45197.1 YVTN repeat-like/Quino protein amine dehydrogenase [Rhizoclosmatium globosum]